MVALKVLQWLSMIEIGTSECKATPPSHKKRFDDEKSKIAAAEMSSSRLIVAADRTNWKVAWVNGE